MKKELFCPQKSYLRLLYLLISGLITGLCITFPTGVGTVISWFSPIPAYFALLGVIGSEKVRYPKVWLYGFLFFMSEYLVIYHWFVSMYPLEFTGMSKGYALCVVLLGWIGLSVLASVSGGAFCVLLVFTCRKLPVGFPGIRPLLTASAYSVFEWFETLGWMGVPWNRLGLSQLGARFSPTLMSSSFFGSYFTAFIMILFAGLLAEGLIYGDSRKFSAIVLAAANLLYGFAAIAVNNGPYSDGMTVAAIQGNISSAEKWDGSKSAVSLEAYTELTRLSAEEGGADIVLWPETAITHVIRDGSDTDIYLRSLAAQTGVLLCVGCFREGGEDGNYNVIRYYRPDGSTDDVSYAKRHLVPFGEYLPWKDFFMTVVPPLAELTMLENGLACGNASAVVNYAGADLGGLICFDSIYEELCADSCREGADIILLATNDSWFGTSAALSMHNNQARLRAIENNVVVLRAANTGISSIIDGNGCVIGRTEANERTYVAGRVPVSSGRSLYSYTGNVFVYVCAAFLALSAAASAYSSLKNRRTNKKRRENDSPA